MIRVVFVLIVSALIAACTGRERSPEPVPVDRVQCARCRMMVSTEVGSAEIVSVREDTRFYDDIGCLAGDWAAHAAGATAYVRVDNTWVDAPHAWYAHTGARTPMNSGLVAYATREAAAAAAKDGRALSWDDVLHI